MSTQQTETPFRIHNYTTYKIVRFATVAEARQAVAAADLPQRRFGDVFFPLYRGQDREEVRAWLEAHAAGECDGCGDRTPNASEPFYFNEADPTEATWRRLCDECRKPHLQPEDYAAPFADKEKER